MTIEDLIKEALTAYGMTGALYELIRHNENITCKVTYEDTCFCLRIHQPVEGFATSLITNGKSEIDLFESEVSLLEYMRQNGFTELHRPIRNLQGDKITVLNKDIPVMMVTWVNGEPIKPEEGDKYAKDLEELACRIHQSARGFTGDRIQYDNTLCNRMIDEIQTAMSLNHISKEAGDNCIRELMVVKAVQKKHINEYILLHSDMGFGNILVTDKGLVPIDFSLSGYGCVAQEAGMLMSNYQDDIVAKKILEGFKECRIEIDPIEADIFLSYSVLLFICSQHEKMHKEEWFADALNRWCSDLFVHWKG